MYKPTQDVFINGRIAEAEDMANEFTAISEETKVIDESITTTTEEALKVAKAYVDISITAYDVDGGTF